MSHQQNPAETAARLVDAAFAELTEHGYFDTRVQAIARRAGFTTGALYGHFPGGKGQLLTVVVSRLTREAVNRYLPSTIPDDVTQPDLTVDWVTDTLTQTPPDIARLIVEAWAAGLHDPDLATSLRELTSVSHAALLGAIERGRRQPPHGLHPDLDPAAVVGVLDALNLGGLLLRAMAVAPSPPRDAVRPLVHRLLCSLTADGPPPLQFPLPDPPPPPPVGDPDGDTVARLLHAAWAELLETGYREASVAQIAQRAGLTTGAIYGRFASKAELLGAVWRTATEAAEAERSEAAQWISASGGQGAAVLGLLVPNIAGPSHDIHRFLVEAWATSLHDESVAAVNRARAEMFEATVRGVLDASRSGGAEIDPRIDADVLVTICRALTTGGVALKAYGFTTLPTDATAAVLGRMAAALQPPG